MSTEVWVAILTFMTAAIGSIRWLLHVYLTQAEKIEDLRSRHEREHLAKLKDTVKQVTLEIEMHRRQIAELNQKLTATTSKIHLASEKIEATSLDLSRSLEKFSKIETTVINLTKDMIMLKGRPKQ